MNLVQNCPPFGFPFTGPPIIPLPSVRTLSIGCDKTKHECQPDAWQDYHCTNTPGYTLKRTEERAQAGSLQSWSDPFCMKGLEELMRVNINTCPCVNISPCLLGTGSMASFLLSLEATEVDKGRWDILLPLNCSKRKCSSSYIYPSLMKSLMTFLRQYSDLFPLWKDAKQSYIEF